jgi:hypothetical protein
LCGGRSVGHQGIARLVFVRDGTGRRRPLGLVCACCQTNSESLGRKESQAVTCQSYGEATACIRTREGESHKVNPLCSTLVAQERETGLSEALAWGQSEQVYWCTSRGKRNAGLVSAIQSKFICEALLR